MAALIVIIGQNWQLPVSLRFEASEGVGMLSERGLVAEGTRNEPFVALEDFALPPGAFDNPDAATDEDDAAQQDLVGESGETTEGAESAPPEESTEPEQSDESSEESASEGADEAAEDAPVDEAELARLEAEEALRQAEARRRRRQRERLEARQEDARQALAQEQAQNEAAAALQAALEAAQNPEASSGTSSDTDADADPSSLPPSQRYPQGTINPVATDLGMWGPEGARIVVVLRNDRIRSSVQREPITRLIESFPDWRTLVGSYELDPFEDIDTLVIASSDPRFINRTFVAAVHHLPPEEVVETLSSGYHDGVNWERERGGLLGRPALRGGIDPRVFYIPTNNVFLFTRPEYIRDLQRGAPSARGMEEALERYAPQADDSVEDDANNATDEEPGGAAPADDSERTEADAGQPAADTSTETDGPEQSAANAGADGEGTDPATQADADTPAVADEASDEGTALAPPPIPREAPDANARQEAAGEPEPPRARPRPVRPDREPPVRDDGWLRGITELADYGGVGDEGPAVMVSTGSIASFRLQGYRGPQPQALHASIYADRDPLVRARVLFDTDREAARFVASWRDIIRSNRASLMVTGLYGTLEGATVEQDMNEANVTFSIPGSTLRRLSITVSQMMQTRGAPTPQ